MPASKQSQRENPIGFHVMGVTFHHLSHILLVGSKPQVPPMLSGRVDGGKEHSGAVA